MNITQAKQIPLRLVVEHLGGRFARHGRSGELWFYSPFRPNERTASFKIDVKRNQWHDFARTEKVDAHGDVLDLWTDYHSKPRRTSSAIKEALKDLQQFSTMPVTRQEYRPEYRPHRSSVNTNAPRYQLVKTPGRIWRMMLRHELERRGLDLEDIQPGTGRGLLTQAQILDTKTQKTFSGFAFQNDKGGYDISIPNPITDKSFKSSIGKKFITTVPGGSRKAYIYEGFWDFFTWLRMNRHEADHTFIILNSASNVRMAADYIFTNKHIINSVSTFLDNDAAGERATQVLKEMLQPEGLTIITMNHTYKGYKDLNDFWMDKL